MNRKSNHTLIILFLHIIFVNMLQAQINTDLYVGAIPGEVDVSPTGATTYTIPIEVVPGLLGMQPNLSIVYNSMSGMGLLGMKWNIAGISSISRSGQIPYFDSNTTAIQFAPGDRYLLDGERLVYATDYHAPEVENFMRFYPTLISGHPKDFTAYTDDGRVIDYGKKSASKQQLDPSINSTILYWNINKMTDVNGNEMIFDYTNPTGESLIRNITYTINTGNGGNGGSTNDRNNGFASVYFDYGTADIPDTLGRNTSFLTGFGVSQNKILRSITISGSQGRVRKYQFNYMHDGNKQGERTVHLKEIVLYGETDNDKLNSTTITWKSQTGFKDTDQATFSKLDTGYVFPGDFNGDGYMDYVLYAQTKSKSVWKLYTYNPSEKKFEDSQKGGTHLSLNNAENNCYFYKADIKGDGCDKLIIARCNDLELRYFFFTILDLKGAVTQQIDTFSIFGFQELYFGDFEGSGRTSILFRNRDYTHTPDKKYTFSLYTANGYIGTDIGLPQMVSSNKVRLGDFTGDGKTNVEFVFNPYHTIDGSEVKIYYYNGSSFAGYSTGLNPQPTPNYLCDRYSGDFNGDGITDLLTYEINGNNSGKLEWKLYFGKGDRTYTDATIISSKLNLEHVTIDGYTIPTYRIMIADLDGDGKDDIIQLQGQSAVIVYSKGCIKNNSNKYEYKYLKKKESASMGNNSSPPKHVMVSDINNDGISDLFVQYDLNSKAKIIYLHKGNQYDCLDSITDGMRKTIKFVFKPKYRIAKNGTAVKKYFYQSIDNIKISDGLNGFHSFNYNFDEPVFSPLRRSFLGFEKFVCINHSESKTDSLFFALVANLDILKPTAQKTFINKNPFSETTYNIAFKGFGKRYIPYSAETIVLDKLQDKKTITTTSLHNDGRISTTNTKTYEFCSSAVNNWMHSETKTYAYTTITIDGNQEKTVPTQIITNQQYSFNGDVIEDTLSYLYYSANEKGRLKMERRDNVHGYLNTYYFSYDPTGVCLKKYISASIAPYRTENYEYDATKRFITKITKPLGQISQYTYDPGTGNILSETDPNGLKTTYLYDGFGNLTQINYPDGTKTTVEKQWHTASTPPRALYYIKTTTTGKAPTTVYYDKFGREVCSETDGFYTVTQYNNKGQIVKTSYPFKDFNNPNIAWNYYAYDIYGRQDTIKTPYSHLSHSYILKQVTIKDHLRNTSTCKNYDALGRITQVEDAGGYIFYSYSIASWLQTNCFQTKITTNGAHTYIISDLWGNKLSIYEPNVGFVRYEYNGFGNMVSQKDALNNKTTWEYDQLGRVKQKNYSNHPNSQKITYTYDTSNNGIGKLHKILIDNKLSETFSYDTLSRLSEHIKTIDSINFIHSYKYDSKGQLSELTYPSGFGVKYIYDPTGKLYNIKRSDNNQSIYTIYKLNKFYAPLSCTYGNSTGTNYEYNEFGLVTRIQTGIMSSSLIIGDVNHRASAEIITVGGMQLGYNLDSTLLNYRYAYDSKGLMCSRSESIFNRKEIFTYDKVDRLTDITYSSGATNTISYQNNGNITNYSKVGTYNYLSTRPNAVAKIEPRNNIVISDNTSTVSYNYFNQPKEIEEGNFQIELNYAADQQRNKMVWEKTDESTGKQFYISKYYEREIDTTSREYHYIYSDKGIVALYVITEVDKKIIPDPRGTADSTAMYYIHTDHLGSYCVLTDANKQAAQRNIFDPWGNYYSFSTNQTQDSIAVLDDWEECQRGLDLKKQYHFNLTRRGFTGHEHYPELKIINMGGRLYDPVIARFFSPDNYVQIPEFTQSFNRYSYCLNNPLSYTDPTGQRWNPVFDMGGKFLGCTSEGFVGEVLIYSGKEFKDWTKMSREGASQYADGSKIDKIDWSSMTAAQATKTYKLTELQKTALSAQAFSKIYTRVLIEGGFNIKNLIGNAVAVMNGGDQFNNPNTKTNFLKGSLGIPSRVTVNQQSKSINLLSTVENIQNALGVHEFTGHGELGFSDVLKTHYKAYELQINHSTWDKTTDVFKREMIGRYLEVYKDQVQGGHYSNNYKNYYEIWKQLDLKLGK